MSETTTTPTLSVYDIQATPRRKDMGDLDALMRDIQAHGLKDPIGVTTTGLLAYGARRLEAVKRLGWQQVPVVLIDLLDPLASTPNHYRGFRMTELTGIGRLVDEHEQRISKLRQSTHFPRVAQAWEGRDVGTPGHSRVKAAKAIGLSPTIYQRAKYIQNAAEVDLRLQRFADQIDAGSSVSRTYLDLREAEDGMNSAATNGNGRAAPRRERPPIGDQKRTGLTANSRLDKIAVSLEGYAEALPAMHTRGEDVDETLTRIARAAGRVRRAARALREGGNA